MIQCMFKTIKLTLHRCIAHLRTSRPRICSAGDRSTIFLTASEIAARSFESTSTRNTTCKESANLSGCSSRQSRTISGPVLGVAMTCARWHNCKVPAAVQPQPAGFITYKLRCTRYLLIRFSSMRVNGTKPSGMLPVEYTCKGNVLIKILCMDTMQTNLCVHARA